MNLHNSFSDKFFKVVTLLGTPIFYVLVLVILLLCHASFAFPLFGALLFVELFCILIKIVYHKDRPVPQSRQGLYNSVDANSFPSVHSSRISLLVTTIIFYYHDALILAVGILFMIGVGYSRIYLGRHHTIDVLAGFLTGVTIALILVTIL